MVKKTSIVTNQLGQGLTEYMIILILISLVSVLAAQKLGKGIESKINKADRRIKTRVNFGDEDG